MTAVLKSNLCKYCNLFETSLGVIQYHANIQCSYSNMVSKGLLGTNNFGITANLSKTTLCVLSVPTNKFKNILQEK